jgi:ABC-type uncharacterized transport system ATPase subunit
MRLTHITKRFGALRAVDDVSLDVAPGEIVALVGENGAGKTTLMRIASGETTADSGSIVTDGSIELVHQHFMLVPELTIAENLALGDRDKFRFASRRMLEREAAQLIEATGIALQRPSRRVSELSVGEKSKLELIKAIARQPSTLILDEPTSVLTPDEAEELFRVIESLAQRGTAVVFISHKLPEVMRIAHKIVVMRAGRIVHEAKAAESTAEELAAAMVETREPSRANTKRMTGTKVALSLGPLTVHESEIVAIVGVAGNGQTELARSLRDSLDRNQSGHIPEDRTRDGIVREMSLAENLALRAPRWSAREAVAHADKIIELYSVRATDASQRAGDLSGGNQQKLILARELEPHPRVIVAAEPTRGLDIQASAFVHGQLRAAAAGGAAIVLITSDLDEAFALADAVHVIYRGTLSARLTVEEAANRIGALMAGVA